MALRNSSTEGRAPVHVEPARPDELPTGVPADAREVSPTDRGERGRFAEGNDLAAAGGRARAGHTRLARRVALGDGFADPRFEPYARAARAFRRAHVTELARSVGGGHCGPGPASIVASAALQLAGSRFAFEVLGDLALGSRLANDSRQGLLAAHELVAREAIGRKAANPGDAHARALATFARPAPTSPAQVVSAQPQTLTAPTANRAPNGTKEPTRGS